MKKNFKFLDNLRDIEGMEYFEQTMGFNGVHFKVQYYTELTSEERTILQMHICATIGSDNMELEENVAKYKNILEEYYYRVNVERVELSDLVDEDEQGYNFDVQQILDNIEPEEINFINEMINVGAHFLFNDEYINKKIYNSRYGRVRYLEHIKPDRNREFWDSTYIVLATKRELDLISLHTNNIWVTVLRYDNIEGTMHLHDRVIMNGYRINNVPYVLTA